ncbi:hypothetical protein P9112_005537 [Eukaryota sp. TZLM1-RC]
MKETLDIRLFGTIVLTKLIPTIYKTFRINLLGNLPSDSGVNIASQVAWLDVAYEIVHECLILPLFFFIGKLMKQSSIGQCTKRKVGSHLRSIYVTAGSIYSIMSLLLILFIRPILQMMGLSDELIQDSVSYMRFETISLMVGTLLRISIIVLMFLDEMQEKALGSTYLLKVLVVQMCVTVAGDAFLLRKGVGSLNLGVLAIAFTNIVATSGCLALTFHFLHRESILIFLKERCPFKWQTQWFKAGSLSGAESFVRNMAFMTIVLRFMNELNHQGTFWLANHFIWSWLLLPVLSLGEVIKRDIGKCPSNVYTSFTLYLRSTLYIIAGWAVSLPVWKWFMKNVMNVEDVNSVFNVVMLSVSFYLVFAINNIIDSMFYGIGRTDLMLYQSILTNGIVYGLTFFLYVKNIYEPSLYSVAFIFGMGIAVDSAITFAMYWYLKPRQKLEPKFEANVAV